MPGDAPEPWESPEEHPSSGQPHEAPAHTAARALGSAESKFAWMDMNPTEQRSSEQEEDGWTVLINCFLCHILNNLVAIPAVCY